MTSPLARTVAVVGSGYWGRNLVRNIHALGVLATVCDTDGEAVKAMLHAYPEVTPCQDFHDVLADPAIRGVVIATPAATHHRLVREALLADKDVFVEKPLALSHLEGVELDRLARERGCILMVGHLLWYHPAVIRLQQLVAAGELGRLQYLYSNRLNLGRLRREENVLWSFAPHDISVILGLVGEMPESVQAQGGNFLHPRIADTTVTLLRFPGGAHAHIFVSWLHPFKEQKLIVVGERKMAVFDDSADWPDKLLLYPHTIRWNGVVPVADKALRQPVELEAEEPLKAECRAFLEAMASRRPPLTDGAEGVRVLRVLNACEQALEHPRPLALEPVPRPYFLHDTATVEEGAVVGEGCRIWNYSRVLPGSVLGRGVNVGQNVVIGPRVVIGDGCKIQNNVSVYEGVTLEEEVFCGPSMVFTNVFNPRAAISRKHTLRPTLLKRGCTVGANATIVCGVTLGRYSFVGAGAVVTRDLPDHTLVVGNPARVIGWMCRCGERLDQALACASCGDRYRLRPEGGLAVAGMS